MREVTAAVVVVLVMKLNNKNNKGLPENIQNFNQNMANGFEVTKKGG